MPTALYDQLEASISGLARDGLLKHEAIIEGPQGAEIIIGGRPHINMCANDYLGLANDPRIIGAATAAMQRYGFGMASVRFICGTLDLHRELEQAVARFLAKDDAILFAACFDANGGLFEGLLGSDDAIVSDTLNHASLIDGIRLARSKRYRFATGNMEDLEAQLRSARSEVEGSILIVTDGVFSMDGMVANLPEICALAERYGAVVAVDDCHAMGHLGATGRGTPELTGVGNRVDIITGTFGKTLGGGMGGFIAGRQSAIDMLRQRARPYLFSNTLAPVMAGGALKALELVENADDARIRLAANAARFRNALGEMGYRLLAGETPIIPVMLDDAMVAQNLAQALGARGIHVAAFSYPVVPKGLARIRTQMSAAHTDLQIDATITAFKEAGKEVGAI